jgi:hypothetical protein
VAFENLSADAFLNIPNSYRMISRARDQGVSVIFQRPYTAFVPSEPLPECASFYVIDVWKLGWKLGLKPGTKYKQAEVITIDNNNTGDGDASKPVPVPKLYTKPGPKPSTKYKQTEVEIIDSNSSKPTSLQKLRKQA